MNLETQEPADGNISQHQDDWLKRCGACRTVGYRDDIYCARCGVLFGPVCSACGSPIAHPVAFYCVRCGVKLKEHLKNA